MRRFITSIIILFVSSLTHSEETDFVVSDKTLVQRCIIDGPSTRMIAVGSPGGFNYAFDAMHCAPVYVWQGQFIDFKGETNGRGGSRCKVLGVKQDLALAKTPIRIGNPDKEPDTISFQGYKRDASSGNPTFILEVDGVSLEQTIDSPSANTVTLSLDFADTNREDVFYRLDPGKHQRIKLSKGLNWSGSGTIKIPADIKQAAITIYLKPTSKAFVRPVEKLTGEEIFRGYCGACHSTDGTKLIGPTFQHFWGKMQIVTANGKTKTITVDESYVRESIMKPQAVIVKGYEAVPMADFSKMLTSEQIDLLVKYLSEL